MKKCAECNGKMAELAGETPEGVEYKYFKCGKCGEEIVNMKQLHDVAQVYSEMRKYHTKNLDRKQFFKIYINHDFPSIYTETHS